MKSFSVIAAVLSLLLIVLTSLPDSHSDVAKPTGSHDVYWVNPDGAHGIATGAGEASASGLSKYAWVNPDGGLGTDQGRLDRLSATDYSWVNPDGATGKISPMHARVGGVEASF